LKIKNKNIMAAQKYKKRFWLILSLVIITVLLVVGGGVGYLVHFSATNVIVCAQCHPEIVDLWKNSKGHPSQSTSCFQCHSPHIVPSEYVADDSLTSQRCLDCHEDVLELGYTVKKKVIVYNHRIHRQEDLECVECHRNAGHEYLDGSSNRPSITECLPCHRKEFEGPPKKLDCRNCHEVMLVPSRMRFND
jgi:hypothetical protein